MSYGDGFGGGSGSGGGGGGVTFGSPVLIGTNNGDTAENGVSTSAARADHVHPVTSLGMIHGDRPTYDRFTGGLEGHSQFAGATTNAIPDDTTPVEVTFELESGYVYLLRTAVTVAATTHSPGVGTALSLLTVSTKTGSAGIIDAVTLNPDGMNAAFSVAPTITWTMASSPDLVFSLTDNSSDGGFVSVMYEIEGRIV